MAYATGRVLAYVKIGMTFMAISIVVTYFALASADAHLPGWGLGSLGLAGKMVVMQILSVNILAWYLARSLEIKFDWFFQLVVALACLGAGSLAYGLSHTLFDMDSPIWLAFLVAGLIYGVMLLTLIATVPNLAGLRQTDIAALLSIGQRLMRR